MTARVWSICSGVWDALATKRNITSECFSKKSDRSGEDAQLLHVPPHFHQHIRVPDVQRDNRALPFTDVEPKEFQFTPHSACCTGRRTTAEVRTC
jgi:hypothetical protein